MNHFGASSFELPSKDEVDEVVVEVKRFLLWLTQHFMRREIPSYHRWTIEVLPQGGTAISQDYVPMKWGIPEQFAKEIKSSNEYKRLCAMIMNRVALQPYFVRDGAGGVERFDSSRETAIWLSIASITSAYLKAAPSMLFSEVIVDDIASRIYEETCKSTVTHRIRFYLAATSVPKALRGCIPVSKP